MNGQIPEIEFKPRKVTFWTPWGSLRVAEGERGCASPAMQRLRKRKADIEATLRLKPKPVRSGL